MAGPFSFSPPHMLFTRQEAAKLGRNFLAGAAKFSAPVIGGIFLI